MEEKKKVCVTESKNFLESKKAKYFGITLVTVVAVGGTMAYFDKYEANLVQNIVLLGLSFGGVQGLQDIAQIANKIWGGR